MDIEDEENSHMEVEEPKESKNEEESLKENFNKKDSEELIENEILKRTEIKNQPINYTIEEKLKILKEYDKIKNQRELSRRYGIALGTLAGWIKNRQF